MKQKKLLNKWFKTKYNLKNEDQILYKNQVSRDEIEKNKLAQ